MVRDRGGKATTGTAPSSSGPLFSETLSRCRAALVWAGGFSLLVNILTLTSSLYMMQVFDRVLSSGSLPTLVYLTLIAVGGLALMAAFDFVRTRILHRVGDWIERRLGTPALERMVEAALTGRGERGESLRDLAAVRGALGSVTFLFDAPWVPVYLAVIYILHPMLGHLALGSGVALFALALLNDRITRGAQRDGAAAARRAQTIAESAARNAEVVEAMNLLPGLVRRWRGERTGALDLQDRAAARSAALLAFTRFLRQAVQVAVIGCGAWLAVGHDISAGAMMAASLVLGRALAPVEQAIGGWRQVNAGREALRRLGGFFNRPPRRPAGMTPPAPTGHLTVRDLAFRVGDAGQPVLRGLSFDAPPGSVLAVVGPSAAGKSTLARLLVGLHPPLTGAARLDGHDLFQWRRDHIGAHIGYLPQDVEIFAGTVAENIARLGEPDGAAVVQAARLAGCHEMISRLPGGYDTEVGEGGVFLSGGQRQRVALARALYGNPRLVVLDEPDASLDTEGERALDGAIAAMREQGACVVVIGHRPGSLARADRVLALRDGRVEAFGPRGEVLDRLKRRVVRAVPAGAGTADDRAGNGTNNSADGGDGEAGAARLPPAAALAPVN